MSIQIIYGQAGAGKSEYIFKNIQEKIIKNPQKKIKVITPDQFSFTAEQKLLNFSPSQSVISAEVITFARMAHRLLGEIGGQTKTHLTGSGRAMLINHILLTQANNFSFLGKSDENVELISRQITELKKHLVQTDTLNKITKEVQNKYLQKKLEDVSSLYDLYVNEIKSKYIDENDGLTILAENLEKSIQFKNCDIYIDEFAGFTTQEYEILRKLLKISDEVVITICADDLNDNTNPDIDLFYANKKTAQKIIEIAKSENIEIKDPIKLSKPYRFKTPELSHLSQNMSAPFYTIYEKEPENLHLFLANNPYSEIENVAIKITKLAKQGVRYEEMAVITKNIGQYSSLVRAIFAGYHIPVFIDEKKDLDNNILVKFVLSLLDIFAKNWSYEAVFSYIKTGLINLNKEQISTFENYCIKWGIKGSKWYSKDWFFYDETEEEKQIILHCKNVVVTPLLQFRDSLKRVKTVKEITTEIYNYLINNNIYNKIEEIIEELKNDGKIEKAKEYETSLKIITKLFDEVVLVLGDKNISFEKYVKILKTGLTQSDLGTIPATLDQVIVGDVDRSRAHKVKAVFIIGLNDGVFPTIKKDEGFLDDNDREFLKGQGIELAKGTLEQLYDDNFNIYKAFTTAENSLFLSYLSSDSEGKSLRPSILINKIKRFFPNLKEKSDVIERTSEILISDTTFNELLVQIRNFSLGEKIEPIWFQIYNYYEKNKKNELENAIKAMGFENVPEKLKQEQTKKLYGNVLKTSVSKLEQYKSCPFSYYLKYGLKIKEKNAFKIERIDTGNFMHEVIDSFFDKLTDLELSVKQVSDEQIKSITEEIVSEKLTLKKYDIFSSIPKYRILAQRLKKVIIRAMKYIVDSIKYSDFEVLGTEIEFKEGRKYPPIIVELKNGTKVEITGKIDRVDIAKLPDGNYIRIIDYKSSARNINLNQVYEGLQLQLLTYLDAICKNEDVLPAAALYFNLKDPDCINTKEEQLEAEIRKQFKMKGLILADSNIVKKMDKTIESGYSSIIPVQITKTGEVSQKQNTVNAKQFEMLQNYMEKIIKQISEEILDGNIVIEPYYTINGKKTPCRYCEYKSVCQFNQTTKNSYRYISDFNNDTVIEQMQKCIN